MRDYRETVRERYDKPPGMSKNDVYAPMGFISLHARIAYQRALQAILLYIGETGLDLTDARILDVGCGSGYWTRFFADMVGSPKNISGVDLSHSRIQRARTMNPAISYSEKDVLLMTENSSTDKAITYDVIVAMTTLMHFNTEQLSQAWMNIYRLLPPGGFLIVLESYARKHDSLSPHKDSCGFTPLELHQVALEHGFRKVKYIRLFRRLGRINTLYMAGRIPHLVLELIETLVPGRPGNFLMLFQKETA